MKSSFLFSSFALFSQTFAQSYWYESITHQGVSPYNSQGSAYQVFRNVKDFGATGMSVSSNFDIRAKMAQVTERRTILLP